MKEDFRGAYWPGKNHNYFKKRKLYMEYFFSFLIFWFSKFFLILKY